MTHPVLDDPEPRRRLPLYDPSYAGDALGPPLPRDPRCPRCDLGRAARHVKNVCLASGKTGGILVVMESPTQGDDSVGRMKADAGVNKAVAAALAPYEASRGPVRWSWAVSCPGRKQLTEAQLEACRPYLSWELDQRPSVVLAFGKEAVFSLTGRAWDPRWLRRGWDRVRGVPTFFFLAPYLAAINRHYRRDLQVDVRWALASPPPFHDRGTGGEARVALTVEEGRELLATLRSGQPTAYDTEHWPRDPWAKEFTLLSVAFCQRGVDPVVVPGALARDLRPEIARLLADPATPKVASNGKHDRHAIWRAIEVDVVGLDWDTQVVGHLMASDERKGLGFLAWKVGLGGVKAVGQEGADDEDDE